MSIDYDSRLILGSYQRDPEAYLIAKGILAPNDLEEKYYGDIEDIAATGVSVILVNGYTGEGYYVGIELGCGDPERFLQETKDAAIMHEELFGDVGSVIHFVRVS